MGSELQRWQVNVGVFFNYYHRDRVSSMMTRVGQALSFRYRIPKKFALKGIRTSKRSNSLYPQMNIKMALDSVRGELTDSSGEFETYPIGDSRCQYTINATTCGRSMGGNLPLRLNNNGFGRDLTTDSVE